MTLYEKSLETLEYEITSLARMLEAINRRRRYPLERAHYLLLQQLREGPLSVGEVAQKLLLDNSTVTRQVNAMAKAKLIEKLPNPNDGRSALVSATQKGKELVEAMHKLRIDRLKKTLANWSIEDKQLLAGLTKRLVRDLMENIDGNCASEENGTGPGNG